MKILYRIKTFLLIGVFSILALQGFAQYSTEKDNEEFKVKGFHLDLRIQVMTPKALKEFARELSSLGLNTLVMEWEGTYPFNKHATISNEYSYTREEIKDFISYCESLDIQVIPLQQSLGHVEYILRNPRYSFLKEDRKDISQLCPMEIDESTSLFKDLFTDLAALHNSEYIHIGGDETYLLGHCEECQKKVEEEGKSKLFVDYMKTIAQIVIDLGKKPVMWADIILKYPEAAEQLPEETIFVDWNYGWKINHFGDIASLQELGFSFWGAPALRSHPDNWYGTNWPVHFKNQKEFIPYARKSNYEGMIMTSWSTSGVYGFTWDVGYDVIDMVQIRNTYPLSGFRILMASFAEALNSTDPIDPETFVQEYARKRFGLGKEDADILWEFFSRPMELIQNGKPVKSESIEQMQKEFSVIRDQLVQLKPSRNEKEFAHFKLMADLRMHYLDFKIIESKYNSPNFSTEEAPKLLEDLEAVFEDAKELDKRFFELNKGFLYEAEIEEQNEIRIEPVQVLYNRLAKLK